MMNSVDFMRYFDIQLRVMLETMEREGFPELVMKAGRGEGALPIEFQKEFARLSKRLAKLSRALCARLEPMANYIPGTLRDQQSRK